MLSCVTRTPDYHSKSFIQTLQPCSNSALSVVLSSHVGLIFFLSMSSVFLQVVACFCEKQVLMVWNLVREGASVNFCPRLCT